MSDEIGDSIELEPTDCPLCGADGFRTVLVTRDQLHGVPGEFRVVRCQKCRHLYMNPRPTPNSILDCYPANYGPHAGSQSSPACASNDTDSPKLQQKRPWYLRPAFRRIPGLRSLYYWLSDSRSEFLPTPDAEHCQALEIGCAVGRFLERLRDAGWNAQGLEPVDSAAEQARQNGFDVWTGLIEDAEFEQETFDAVFAWMVIEHLPDPAAALSQINGWLRDGGCLSISVPNAACWEPFVFRKFWYVWELPRHLHHFSPARIRLLLEDSGFTDVTIIHQRNLLNVVGSLGLLATRFAPGSRLARRILDYPDNPRMWSQLLIAPVAILLAALKQGGRLTIVARKSGPPSSRQPAATAALSNADHS